MEPVQACLSFPAALTHPWWLAGTREVPTVPLSSLPPCSSSGNRVPPAPRPFPPTSAPPNVRSRSLGSLPVALSPPPEMAPRHLWGHCDPPCPRAGVCWDSPAQGRATAGLGREGVPAPGSIPCRVPERRDGCHRGVTGVSQGHGCRVDMARWGPALAQEPSCD